VYECVCGGGGRKAGGRRTASNHHTWAAMPGTSHIALRCSRVLGELRHVVPICQARTKTFPCQRDGKPTFVKPTRYAMPVACATAASMAGASIVEQRATAGWPSASSTYTRSIWDVQRVRVGYAKLPPRRAPGGPADRTQDSRDVRVRRPQDAHARKPTTLPYKETMSK
jgi:hypothetical protein